jgi:hypothetical protein
LIRDDDVFYVNISPKSNILNDSLITNQDLGEKFSFEVTPGREAFHSLISNSHYYLYPGMFKASHVLTIIHDPTRMLSLGS